VCASVTARRLRELDVPEDLEIIEEDRILDKGGIEMLGQLSRIAQGTE
jgi:GntR family transcriptional regulator